MNKKKKTLKLDEKKGKLTESKENISHIKSFKRHIDLSFFRWNGKKFKEKLDKEQ